MNRLLFIIAIIAVIFLWVKSARKQQQGRRDESAASESEEMVRCVVCGVHLPRSEGYFVGGKYYCSEAHSRGTTGKSD